MKYRQKVIKIKQTINEIEIPIGTPVSIQPYEHYYTADAVEMKKVVMNKKLHKTDIVVLVYYFALAGEQMKLLGYNRCAYNPIKDMKEIKISRKSFFESIKRLENEKYIKREDKIVEILIINSNISYNGAKNIRLDYDRANDAYFDEKITYESFSEVITKSIKREKVIEQQNNKQLDLFTKNSNIKWEDSADQEYHGYSDYKKQEYPQKKDK